MSQTEFDIIRQYFADSQLSFDRPGLELGIGDDGALLSVPKDRQLCLSMDVLVEGVHFPRDADPFLLAQRAVAVNLSDLAAMGAEPLCFTLGLVLRTADADWLSAFSRGLMVPAQQFQLPLAGGDLTAGPACMITIQVHGILDPARAIRRDRARPGDAIYVSGFLGDGALALASLGLHSHLGGDLLSVDALPTEHANYFRAAYYQPRPRIELAAAVAGLVNSGIDISDGLYGDLDHILEASAVGAILDPDALPCSAAARACADADVRRRAALFGGDDYELCLTVAAEHLKAFESEAANLGETVTRVGTIVELSALGDSDLQRSGAGSSRIRCQDVQGRTIAPGDHAYLHFGGGSAI